MLRHILLLVTYFKAVNLIVKSSQILTNYYINLNYILVVDTRSVETTIRMEQYMQMCYSLRWRQIDMSTVDQLASVFPNNAGTPRFKEFLTITNICDEILLKIIENSFKIEKSRPFYLDGTS